MARPNVYVTRQIPQEGIDLLQASCDVEINPNDRPLTREELLEKIKGRDAVLCLLTDKIDAEVYETAAGVKGFANYAVGYDNIDVQEATKRGIPISNTPGVLTDATAEMAWALLFAVGRRVIESDAVMRSGEWKGWGPMQFIGGDVTGATLGIVGAGRIGAAMAMKSKGFNMNVLYTDAFRNETLEKELGAQKVELEELCSNRITSVSMYPCCRKPVAPGMKEFQLMKKTAYLINTARGPIVNETELVQALKEGEIAGAGLDVYENEPLMVEGLAELPNVVLTPHTASATKSSRGGMARIAAENILAMVKGEKAPTCVNPDVYK